MARLRLQSINGLLAASIVRREEGERETPDREDGKKRGNQMNEWIEWMNKESIVNQEIERIHFLSRATWKGIHFPTSSPFCQLCSSFLSFRSLDDHHSVYGDEKNDAWR